MKKATVLFVSCLLAFNVFCQLRFETKLVDGFNLNTVNSISDQRNPNIDFVNYSNSSLNFGSKKTYYYSYEHYESIYKKSTKTRNYGITLTVMGLGLTALTILMNQTGNYKENLVENIYIAGAISFNVGAFIWTFYQIKSKNNKKAMEKVGK